MQIQISLQKKKTFINKVIEKVYNSNYVDILEFILCTKIGKNVKLFSKLTFDVSFPILLSPSSSNCHMWVFLNLIPPNPSPFPV